MNFCSYCGIKLLSQTNFCNNCGNNLQFSLSNDKSEIKQFKKSNLRKNNPAETLEYIDNEDFGCKIGDIFIENSKDIESIKIGRQVWSKHNLDINAYQNGDLIPNVQDNKEWKNLKTGAWCFYENNHQNTWKYGKLYNWYAINDSRGFAPIGWRIPTDNDWIQLINFLGGNELAGKKLRDFEGFIDIAGGYRQFNGVFSAINESGNFWSNSESNQKALQTTIQCNEFYKRDWTELHLTLLGVEKEKNPFFNRLTNGHEYSKNGGFSIRLIKI